MVEVEVHVFEESQRVGAKTENMAYTFRGFTVNIK
jgi:hypothetical protein